MENNLKNDFTGTWICRDEKTRSVYGIADAFFHYENGYDIDQDGNCSKDCAYDLMERISEKDPRR